MTAFILFNFFLTLDYINDILFIYEEKWDWFPHELKFETNSIKFDY